MSVFQSLRGVAGALVGDWRRYRTSMRAAHPEYLQICNRGERLLAAPEGDIGFDCDWPWTTDLNAPKHLPWLGRQLLKRALTDDRVALRDAPVSPSESPDISFVIGHRGAARIPHLLLTLKSIAGQSQANVECIVVEQDTESRLPSVLPPWVRYIHTPPPTTTMPYCRSWAFNVGVQHARAKVLILHDNDIVVPEFYAREAARRCAQGHDFANLKRFIFYLSEMHTTEIFAERAAFEQLAPLSIGQNLEGGGSLVTTRDAYDDVGGMDETFIGWGGEDNEFWERAQTRPHWPYSYMSLVHLWHPAQAGKGNRSNETLSRYYTLAQIDPAERIRILKVRGRGASHGPFGWLENPS